MSIDKQIEEIAEDVHKAFSVANSMCLCTKCDDCKFNDKRILSKTILRCRSNAVSAELIDKGYRKASDVAREIFAEIERLLKRHRIEFDMSCIDNIAFKKSLAELKKKYESEETE